MAADTPESCHLPHPPPTLCGGLCPVVAWPTPLIVDGGPVCWVGRYLYKLFHLQVPTFSLPKVTLDWNRVPVPPLHNDATFLGLVVPPFRSHTLLCR